MAVKRIVPNIGAAQVGAAKEFYGEIFDLKVAIDLGWIVTFVTNAESKPQISVASEGGSGAPVPDISIEVDNFDDVYQRAVRSGLQNRIWSLD